jgi:hypothetical protein
MNCNDCGGFLPRGCECSPFGGRRTQPPVKLVEGPPREIGQGLDRFGEHLDRPAPVSGVTEGVPIPPELAARIAVALECGVLWTENTEAHSRMQRAVADFNEWRTRGVALGEAPSKENDRG